MHQFASVFAKQRRTPHLAGHSAKTDALMLGMETFSHPPYFSDLSQTDYHFVRVLDAKLRQREFADTMQVENAIADFINSSNPHFYHDGIFSLRDHWETKLWRFE